MTILLTGIIYIFDIESKVQYLRECENLKEWGLYLQYGTWHCIAPGNIMWHVVFDKLYGSRR